MSCFSMTVKQHPVHYEAPAAAETHNESFLSNFIFNTPALCEGFVQKNVGQKGATWEFQRASLATRPQMHSHTHPSHTCANSPSDFLSPAHPHFLRARTLASLFSRALALGHSVNIYSSLMPRCSGTGTQTAHAHTHTVESDNVRAVRFF